MGQPQFESHSVELNQRRDKRRFTQGPNIGGPGIEPDLCKMAFTARRAASLADSMQAISVFVFT